MVHPTSVTNLVDRLEAQGLVERTVDSADRRRILASLTAEGRRVLKKATDALTDIEFAVGALAPADQEKAYELLRVLRSSDFDG
jgi:DNA-binding MarR family transcriptional regulator